MSRFITRSNGIRLLIVAVTIALTWGSLMLGQQRSDLVVNVGQPSPQDFYAPKYVKVVDTEETQRERDAAAAQIDPVYSPKPERTQEVIGAISGLFDTVAANLFKDEEVPGSTTTSSSSSTTTTQATTTTAADTSGSTTSSTTTTTEAPKTTDVTGTVFLDADGDGVYDEDAGDAPAAGVGVAITDGRGTALQTGTDRLGQYTLAGVVVGTVVVDVDESTLPLHFVLSTGNDPQSLTAQEGKVLTVDPIGYAPLVRSVETQEELLKEAYPALSDDTVRKLVEVATGDVMRTATGRPPNLANMREKALDRANLLLQQGIRNGEGLRAAQVGLEFTPELVLINGERDDEAGAAVSDIVSSMLQINQFEDPEATETLRQEARDAVPDVQVEYQQGALIVATGQTVTSAQKAAIEELGLLHQTGPERAAMLLVVVLVVGMLIFYLARFRAQFWANTRRVILFGMLIVLSALVARGVAMLTPADNPAVGYLLPAALFGFMAAILFDPRIGVIMAMAVGALTGLATRDPGLTLFALLSAMTPIPFVSSISARGDLRRAIVYTAAVMFPMAAGIAWYFDGPQYAVQAGLYGFANGLFLSGLIAVAAVSFFEIMFDVTTTLRLLDLTDRNHPALQMMEEKARGTFNHSLMVGTLADRAAKAIGADNLLARAAAYYHDLGKTENPQYFIENQFGISNPHDLLPPERSAEIIRRHTRDGVELAKKYRIPSAVAEGIVSHHGDGIMRYFYHKACERYGKENVDVDDYRHYGHKPRTKEMAILMLADALEGAARAVFSEEDPTPEKIEEVVERVVGEKVADGQLSESDLTLGELTKVKAALVDALIGYYHQRIPYPGFPTVPTAPPAVAGAGTAETPTARQAGTGDES